MRKFLYTATYLCKAIITITKGAGNDIMLNQIIFLLKDQEKLQELTKEKTFLEGAGIGITITEQWINPKSKMNVLYVVDSEEGLKLCRLKQAEPVAFLHEKNGGEDLGQTLLAVSDPLELGPEDWERLWRRNGQLPWDILETKRLLVRETTVADVDSFYEIYSSPEITRYMEGLYENPEEERNYIREYIEKIYSFYGFGMWTVVKKENWEVIGRAGLSFREGFEYPELGFLIAQKEQHKGYAEEVCRGILEYGRNELQFEVIQALVKPENQASASLCKKLGFRFVDSVSDRGIDYDRYLYSKSSENKSSGM